MKNVEKVRFSQKLSTLSTQIDVDLVNYSLLKKRTNVLGSCDENVKMSKKIGLNLDF